jgi:hypothetical protein
MRKLALHHEELLQGEFTKKKLNLLLVFQVNCPGCFLYALPLFNRLMADLHAENISFLGLSTAFEDFDKNTLKNTQDLINKGTLVGETQKHFATHNIQRLPYPIEFPVAMDQKLRSHDDMEGIVNHICHLNPNFRLWSTFDQDGLQGKVLGYLKSMNEISLTFTLNQMKGTPSIVLFNAENEILQMWFGHASYEAIVEMIKQHKH